jgi:predicted nuclease of restriction endonuclease-like (RecB) superfamily
MILSQQEAEGWGAKVVQQIADDLRKEFPDMKGFSRTNLKYMTAFARNYGEIPIGQQPVDQLAQGALGLPWGHNIALMQKVKEPAERLWYMNQCGQHGWSRNVLIHQIESGLYERKGGAVTNFEKTLSGTQSELAQETLKSPYVFDFLTLAEDHKERDIEQQLTQHVQKFLLELGAGFAFVGRQHYLEVGGSDFYIDLLFYHLKLRCYVVIELKNEAFQPEHAGKLNFYLSAVDDMLRHPDDAPSIGLLLCKHQNGIIAEYALRDMNKPIGVSAYQLTKALPTDLKGSLPSIEELEAGLDD